MRRKKHQKDYSVKFLKWRSWWTRDRLWSNPENDRRRSDKKEIATQWQEHEWAMEDAQEWREWDDYDYYDSEESWKAWEIEVCWSQYEHDEWNDTEEDTEWD